MTDSHGVQDLRVFSTLSPIPGFFSWLESKLAFELQPENKFSEKSALLNETDVKLLKQLDKRETSPAQILIVSGSFSNFKFDNLFVGGAEI